MSARKTVRKLKCISCGSKPTAAEVDEMLSNFGPDVKPNDSLVRLCQPCLDRGVKIGDFARKRLS